MYPHCQRGPTAMKFCTGIDHQSVGSNMKKDLFKIDDVIDNDVIHTVTSVICPKIHKIKNMKMQLILLLMVISWQNFAQGSS